MSETARWALPLLTAGQAQKEMTVNESLAALDLLAGASAVAVGTTTPPIAPVVGQCWVVGASPTGAWSAQADALAGWTEGGWRFVSPREGWRVWSEADGCPATFAGGAWRVGTLAATEVTVAGLRVVGPRRPAIAGATGGSVVDAQARGAIDQVLAALVAHGLIAP